MTDHTKGISALIKGDLESSLTLSTLGGHSEKSVVHNLEEGLHQNPTKLAA